MEEKAKIPDKVIDEKYIKDLELHCESCKKATDYAITRFDILIIALSSGALAFSADFIKDIAPVTDNKDSVALKISWALFGTAIIFNFFSQIT